MDLPKQPYITRVSLSDGDSEELLVTEVDFNLYRLEESSLFGEVNYHDIIETELESDGTLRLLRVVASSGLKTVGWIAADAQLNSPGLKLLLDKVMNVGGNWERTFGGVLTIHLPPATADAIIGEFNSFFCNAAGSS